MLFQESALFDSLTIEENVAYPLLNQPSIKCPPDRGAATREREALEFVELERTLEKFPSELSGGMRRRAAIARAVVTEPAAGYCTIRPPRGWTRSRRTPSSRC